MPKPILPASHKALIRRYLLWAYKSTKESFERIERKTTQLMVDEHILQSLLTANHRVPGRKAAAYEAQLQEFKDYIAAKRADELKLKFTAKARELDPQYLFLIDRLDAIEAAVRHFLGDKELRAMQRLYEKEFTRRILESREH